MVSAVGLKIISALGTWARFVGVTGVVATCLVATTSAASAADTSAPSEPGAVTVSGLTASSATLSWARSKDNVGIEGYRVYRGPAAGAFNLIATTDAVASYSATRL